MKIAFYGVRGSIPSPGPDTAKFGGNTSCVHVQLDNGKHLIFDAGTGIRLLGKTLVDTEGPLFLLLSHNHWDHIQGFPFFLPIYQRERHIRIFSSVENPANLLAVLGQMDGAVFPVPASALPSRMENLYARDIEQEFAAEGLQIRMKPLNHPGGGVGFRIEEGSRALAYVTDNELLPPGETRTSYDQWVEFLSGVDVLIHDAQYLQADMPHKHGWGHSLVSQVRQLAFDAEVRMLAMFHHDPERTDGELEEIQRENEQFFKGKRAPAKSLCSWEGLRLALRSSHSPGAANHIEIE